MWDTLREDVRRNDRASAVHDAEALAAIVRRAARMRGAELPALGWDAAYVAWRPFAWAAARGRWPATPR